eukprot:scaffold13786_cov58-Phaeocystis_antarctica.AAC.8
MLPRVTLTMLLRGLGRAIILGLGLPPRRGRPARSPRPEPGRRDLEARDVLGEPGARRTLRRPARGRWRARSCPAAAHPPAAGALPPACVEQQQQPVTGTHGVSTRSVGALMRMGEVSWPARSCRRLSSSIAMSPFTSVAPDPSAPPAPSDPSAPSAPSAPVAERAARASTTSESARSVIDDDGRPLRSSDAPCAGES